MENGDRSLSPSSQIKKIFAETSLKSHKTGSKNTASSVILNKSDVEDLLKLAIDKNQIKTPVSELHELLSRRSIIPTYELVQLEDEVKPRSFIYRVTINDNDIALSTMGAGRSKKEAKHAAAKSLIEKMAESSTSPIPDEREKHVKISKTENDKDKINAIGLLQEICVARRWPPPAYEIELVGGLPHDRQFTAICTVSMFREVGYGKSKKLAKHDAAKKMRTNLEDVQLYQNQLITTINEGSNVENGAAGSDVKTKNPENTPKPEVIKKFETKPDDYTSGVPIMKINNPEKTTKPDNKRTSDAKPESPSSKKSKTT